MVLEILSVGDQGATLTPFTKMGATLMLVTPLSEEPPLRYRFETEIVGVTPGLLEVALIVPVNVSVPPVPVTEGTTVVEPFTLKFNPASC